MAKSLSGCFILLLLIQLIAIGSSSPQAGATFKVGAWGDDASRNNFGVKVLIETHAYNTRQDSFDYFWVGDDLSDGAFIQFGYSLEPGNHCLRGAVLGGTFTCSGHWEPILNSDARWQWQYWPDRSKSDFYFGIGPSASAGSNGTIHEYAISANSTNTWIFTLDGTPVSQITIPVTPSIDPVLIVAEASAGNSSQPLGPVRFDGLSYFDSGRWKMVDALVAVSYCGISVGCVANHYGASAVGFGSLLAGSGIPRSPDGTLLWTRQEEAFDVHVHPGVQFFVTSIVGTQAYEGDANLQLPKGMFAYVSLAETVVSTPGVLGLFGAQDLFQTWVGSVNSQNPTVKVLVGSNTTLTAVWTTSVTLPIIICLVALALGFGLSFFFISKRRLKRHAPA